MKFAIALVVLVLASVGQAASWESIQAGAEKKFLGQTQVQFNSGEPHSLDNQLLEFNFRQPISEVKVNSVDDLVMKGKAAVERLLSLTSEADYNIVEIFIMNDSEGLNCYARFSSGKNPTLFSCELM